MEKLFENIIDKNEVLIKTIKPNKKVFYTNLIAKSLILTLIVVVLILIFSDWEFSFDQTVSTSYWLQLTIFLGYILVWVLGFSAIVALITLFFGRIYYKKHCYAYTNKRIIIRSGVLGLSYKIINLASIGAVDVNVGLIDKILRKNTGDIFFESIAHSSVWFSSITNPYENYKEINTLIKNVKEQNKSLGETHGKTI